MAGNTVDNDILLWLCGGWLWWLDFGTYAVGLQESRTEVNVRNYEENCQMDE